MNTITYYVGPDKAIIDQLHECLPLGCTMETEDTTQDVGADEPNVMPVVKLTITMPNHLDAQGVFDLAMAFRNVFDGIDLED